MSYRNLPRAIALGGLVAVAAVALQAQVTSGSIAGAVRDKNGAYIPKASVALDDNAIGLHRTTAATGAGTFVFPDLPPGTYHLTVTAAGFQKLEKTGVILSTGDKLGAGDLTLSVGADSETVTVQANTAQLQLQSQSGERSDVITGKQLNDIAMNGRNVLDMMRLIPGITSTFDGQQSGKGGLDSFNVNGTRGNQHNLTVDGVSNIDSGNNGTVQVTVNPDAVSQLKVLTSNFQAEYGKAGGAQISLSTVAGTNQFHGDLRYFYRDKGLNANSYFNNILGKNPDGSEVAPRVGYHYNYYGYQIGGPVIFPGTGFNKHRDKLYFFFSQEYYKQLLPAGSNRIQVPTPAELSGDFSQSQDGNGKALVITDPTTGNPFPNNQIPANRINTTLQGELQKLFPAPNLTGSPQYNYFTQASTEHPRREEIARVDWQINPANRIYVRYIHNQDDQTLPFGSNPNGISNFGIPGGFNNHSPGWNFAVNATTTITPTLLNELTFGASHNIYQVTSPNNLISRTGFGVDLPLVFPVDGGTSIPDVSFGGVPNQTLPYTYTGSIPFLNSATLIDATDNVTKVLGQHTLKAGFFFERSRKDQNSFGNSNGDFNFDGQDSAHPELQSGDPFSNALLGNYVSFQQTNTRARGFYRYTNAEGFVQDTWRVRPTLTLDYGIRFTWYQPQYDAQDQVENFFPETFDATKAVRLFVSNGSGGAIDPGNPGTVYPGIYAGNIVPNSGSLGNGIGQGGHGFPQGGFNDRGVMYEPRVGFAWDPYGRNRTVVRGGFGISHDRYQGNPLYNLVTSNPPSIENPTFRYGNAGGLPNLGSGTSAVLAPPALSSFSRDGHVPSIYSYSFGVQQEIGAGTTFDLAYVGTTGEHLSQQLNLNYIPYGTTFTRAAQDPSKYPGGVVPDTEADLPAIYTGAGLHYQGDKAYDSQFLRRYIGYQDIANIEFAGRSPYNSLQLSIQRRFAKRLTLGGVYTWSRTLTTSNGDTDYVSPYGARLYSYHLADYDRTHVMAINYVYDLPPVARYLGDSRVVRAITDGFQLSGITQVQSGSPAGTSSNDVGLNLPNAGQLISGSYTEAPNLFLSHDPNHHVGSSKFDPTAFVLPPLGFQPPSPRTYIRNPGWWNFDMSLFKNIPLGHDSARYLQLRMEAFNVFNHTNFSSYNLNAQATAPDGSTDANSILNNYAASTAINPNQLRSTSNNGILGNYFGEPNGQNTGTGGPRVVQLAAKVYF